MLGSFPSQASLAEGHYYAHPRNQFWGLISAALQEDLLSMDWPARYRRLKARGIALWDVILDCERPGSLDADIRDPRSNDLDTLLARLPKLSRVLFNGATAGRHAQRFADAGFEVAVLPSSSPAHAALSFDAKRELWCEALGRQAPASGAVEVPITLSEASGVRYLHFGSPWVQGAMLIARPDLLVLDYVQRMMAWMLFLAAPSRMLQLGLGAGSLTRFVHAFLPQTAVTVVERSESVIQVARACFALPPDGSRLTVSCADAGAFVAQKRLGDRFGVVQVDLYDEHARGPVIDSEDFYRDCRRVLADPGICVVNLFGSHRSFTPNLSRLSKAFDGRLLTLPPTPAGNQIVLAFRGPALRVEWGLLEQRAAFLEERFGWPAVQWCALLRKTYGGAACEV